MTTHNSSKLVTIEYPGYESLPGFKSVSTPSIATSLLSMHQHRWAFIVPGDSIVDQNPGLIDFLDAADKTWDQFVSLALAEIIGHINDFDIEILDAVAEVVEMMVKHPTAEPIPAHSSIDDIVVDVMEGLDIVEGDGEVGSELFEKQYEIILKAVLSLLQLVILYVPFFYREPREDHGTPVELSLLRTIGKDLVFMIEYEDPDITISQLERAAP
jgi:hypothetical protein